MPPDPARTPRRRLRCRLLVALGVVAAGLILVAALLPTLIATGFARGQILARINATLAPGRLAVDRFAVSWTKPTRLVGFALISPDGARVVSTPVAELDRSLVGLLFGGKAPIILDLGAADLKVERRPDGTLDLGEALQGAIAHPDPAADLTIRIKGGTLNVHAAGLADPIAARDVDLSLRVRPAPEPTSWLLKLVHPDGGDLTIRGETNRWTAPAADPARADLQLGFTPNRWPVANRVGGLSGSGQLNGVVEVARRSGRWDIEATTELHDASLTGPALSGDTLRPGTIILRGDLGAGPAGWTVRHLTLRSAVGSLRGEGVIGTQTGPSGPGDAARRIEGRLDLAAIARQLPHALRLRPGLSVDGGEARLVAEWAGPTNQSTVTLDATLADLAGRDGDRSYRLRDPATLAARVVRSGELTTIQKLAARTSFGSMEATGRLDDARLTGTLDLAALRQQLAEWFDLGPADASGRVNLAGTYKISDHAYHADLRVDGADLRPGGSAAAAGDPARSSLHLVASGPPTGPGWPGGCDSADLTASAGSNEARVELHRAGNVLALGGRVVAGLPGAGSTRRVEATVAGSWDEGRQILSCDRIAARLHDGQDDRLLFAATGEVDPGAGTARFDPIAEPTPASGPVRLGPAGVRIAGLGRDVAAIRVDASLLGDLADSGDRWSGLVHAQGDAQGLQFAADGRVEPADGRVVVGQLGSFRLAGRYDRAADRVALAECRAQGRAGEFTATGQLDDPAGARRFDLRGQVTPDFAALTARLRAEVEPGAQVAGQPGRFHLGGTLSGGDPLRSIEGEATFPLDGVDVCGIKLGPTSIVVHARGGEVRVDPIVTTLNEGQIRLEPTIVLDDAGRGPVLRLGSGSSIQDARINEEVSRRVLAFVAPVLEGTTRATGRVSVAVDRAEVPLGPGRAKSAQLDGSVVFADVAFAPGPLAADLLGTIGRSDAVLRLDRPVTLTIADGRVNTSGLALPIGALTRIELAGAVGFDRTLDLTASLPVTAAMLGNNPLLSDIAAGTQVRLPIGGTLDRPAIDRDAFAANLKDLGKSLLTRGATRGALEILNRLSRPRDPDAPPPPTAAERKAARQDRRAERKAERQGNPNP